MNSKKGRIAAFIDTLPSIDISEGAQSTLLKSSMDFVGGSTTNDKNCTNQNKQACDKSKNAGSCKNSVNFCNNSTNGGDCGPDVFIPVLPPFGPGVEANARTTCPG